MAIKVGVFDSGIGGLTVLAELRNHLGHLDYVYLGDTAHVPYGEKSPEQIEKLSVDCARRLKNKGVDALVVACNTAASWALPAIRAIMAPIPVFDVVEPGIGAALEALNSLRKTELDRPAILVLATRATVKSHSYANTLSRVLKKTRIGEAELPTVALFEQACPLLVPIIEEGWIDHPVLDQVLAEYVAPYRKGEPGVALLGCTHYPWIHQAVEKALPGWTVVNSARAIVGALEKNEWIKKRLNLGGNPGKVEWIFTDPQVVPNFTLKWLEQEFPSSGYFFKVQ